VTPVPHNGCRPPSASYLRVERFELWLDILVLAQASRREGTDLFWGSARRSLDSKCALENAPGQHAQKGQQQVQITARQLRETHKIKRVYGILERQLDRFFLKLNVVEVLLVRTYCTC